MMPLHIILVYLPTSLFITILPILLFIAHTSNSSKPRGCRRLGLPADQSNLSDEFEFSLSPPSATTDIKIKALFTYPLKSCRGIELSTSAVAATGLEYDRQFCIAELIPAHTKKDGESELRWEFRTLRNKEYDKLALVSTEIWLPDPTCQDYGGDLEEVRSGGVLVVQYPRTSSSRILSMGMRLGVVEKSVSFWVPLYPQQQYPVVNVQIWKDFPLAYDYACHLPDSFLNFLTYNTSKKKKITLLRTNPSSYRPIYRNAPRRDVLGYQPHTAFADAYPLHLLSLASVQDVARRCVHAIPRLSARRFRANIIVSGIQAYAEDEWKRILLLPAEPEPEPEPELFHAANPNTEGNDHQSRTNGDRKNVEIYTCCRTVRCKLPNVDPDTGYRHPREPEKTLKGYRCIDKGGGDKLACLGMQCVPAVENFEIRVGDTIAVLERGEHFYIRMLAPGDPEV
ncbi:hypothetical protein BGW36DRAFT_388489 [Talaromyces proteolyticus]|uniref:MOSC domain-containing protein n=1 Tax=Talaromyces proteolyticus TaxID=1131652 RepID=A0AAD4KHU3_9EURO|nr:uncharacterized protein BGW36DRAFT_388489 [Talaromyces proteolyticus]KAH8691532.1 hypothetical protein BGW36DRAFT_388489 [Talaromyces proteolyticus]